MLLSSKRRELRWSLIFYFQYKILACTVPIPIPIPSPLVNNFGNILTVSTLKRICSTNSFSVSQPGPDLWFPQRP